MEAMTPLTINVKDAAAYHSGVGMEAMTEPIEISNWKIAYHSGVGMEAMTNHYVDTKTFTVN